MMSFILSWRRVVAASVLLMAVAGLVASRSLPGADAQQQPGSQTVITTGIPVTASNGFATLPMGTDDGVFGVACTGASPLGGTSRIPAMVVTQFGVDDTRLRIVQANGVTVTGTVRVNCVIEVDLTPEGAATVDRLRAAASTG